MAVHSVIDVSHWVPIGDEQVGTKPKEWLLNPDDQSRWLWKAVTEGLTKEGVSYPKGDDWAESLASLAARSLGVPCAHVEMATRNGMPGTVSEDFTQGAELALGNVLLSVFDEYPSTADRFDPHYTVARVLEVLADIDGPADGPFDAAIDCFVGFLVLDGWIGNSDRHHQNWGVLIEQSEAMTVRLAPSFDHASSLGFLLHDDERSVRLETKDPARTVELWADRARSPFAGRPHPCEVAIDALQTTSPATADYWLGKLENATEGIDEMLEAMPAGKLTGVAAAFASRLLRHNGSRMLSYPLPNLQT